MISDLSIIFGASLTALILLTTICGPEGARRSAITLAGNWLFCMAFVGLTGNYTPWGWFWTIDLLSAAVVTIRPMSGWQAALAYIYMGQLGLHGWFAITGGDPRRYLSWLDGLLIIQISLVFTWTGGHGLNRIWRAYRHRALRFVRISGASDS